MEFNEVDHEGCGAKHEPSYVTNCYIEVRDDGSGKPMFEFLSCGRVIIRLDNYVIIPREKWEGHLKWGVAVVRELDQDEFWQTVIDAQG